MRIEEGIKLDFKDVLIRPKRSTLRSRADVDLVREFTFLHTKKTWAGVPIIAANMDTTGTFAMASALAEHSMLTCIHKHYTVDEWKDFAGSHPNVLNHVAVSSGTTANDLEKLNAVLRDIPAIPFICLDVANGYSENFVQFIRRVREAHPQISIIAGNVVTGEMTEQLILSGADVVKVGIGPGSVCTTRIKTGVGYPQLSAVIECADAAHGLGGQIVSDGGCVVPGDVAKAFGAGSDFVMCGGMFAGHDESGGELVEKGGVQYREFYGMSSSKAMHTHAGGVAEYRASEGKSVLIPYRGPVRETCLDMLGGLRSTCTYVGALHLKELTKRCSFIRVTQQANEVFQMSNPN